MIEPTTSQGFSKLPEEILVLILEELTTQTARHWHIVDDFPNIKNLRLACRDYAYLPRLLAILFSRIRLVAAPNYIELLETTDISVLVPYVKRIIFEPTRLTWDMTFELFEDTVIFRALCSFIDKHNDAQRERPEGEARDLIDSSDLTRSGVKGTPRDLQKAFVERYLDGEQPCSQQDLERDYASYMESANEARQLFTSGRLLTAWSSALRRLPGAKHFVVSGERVSTSSWKAEERFLHVCTHHHFYHRRLHAENRCWRAQETVGEVLFSAALASISASGNKVKQLDIYYYGDGDFTWADDGHLDGVNFSKLHTLRFYPQCEGWDFADGRKAHVARRCGLALTELLRHSAESIEVLEVQPIVGCPQDWPSATGAPFMLPKMHWFEIGGTINLTAFAAFLRHCPKLKYLTLNGNLGRKGQWRELWRAIRYHPSRMTVDFDQVPCNDAAEISLNHFTGGESEGLLSGDPWQDVDISLCNYLSRRGKWDKSMRVWFEGELTDDERSESGASVELGLGRDTEMGEEW